MNDVLFAIVSVVVVIAMLAIAVIGGLVLLQRLDVDRGKCLASHTVHFHSDSTVSISITPDGTPTITPVAGEDYDMTTCDTWEFPNGKAEKD